MFFFDINAALGEVEGAAHLGFSTVDQLQAEMSRLRIGGALVHHLDARKDMDGGNRRLLEAIREHPNLFACWRVNFRAVGSIDGIRPRVREGMDGGVRAFRLELPPQEITSWGGYLEELLRALADAEVPLLFEFQGNPRSDHLVFLGDMVERHPLLSVVLLGVRDVYPVLERHGSVYAEYHDTPFPETLAPARDRLISRLVFGTGLPLVAGECAVEQTLLSGLLPSEQQMLASGNAQRILSIPELPNLPALLVQPVKRPPGLVIDTSAAPGTLARLYGPDEDLTSTHRPGVHRAILDGLPDSSPRTGRGSAETRAVEAVPWEAYRGRIWGYARVEPDGFDVNRFAEAGDQTPCAGLRLAGGALSSGAFDSALSFAQERGLPVLLPPWPGPEGASEINPADLERLAARFPRVSFVWPGASRWDGINPVGRTALERIREVPNLFLTVSGHTARRGALSALVELVGSRKLMFGSEFRADADASELARRLGYVTLSPLEYRDKMNILGGTAYRVFSLT